MYDENGILLNDAYLCQNLQETFPQHEVTSIQFAYDVKKLQATHLELGKAKSALQYCKNKQRGDMGDLSDTFQEVQKHKRPCSCWCCCKRAPGVEFYEEKIKQLSQEFNRQKEISLQRPVGTVFISFKTNQMAKDVYDKFNRGAFSLWKPKRLKSTMDKYLRIKKWNVLYAPEEEDIYWETLSNSKGARGYYYYKLKYFVVNLALLTFLLFLTTPCKCNIKIKLSIQFIVIILRLGN